jgi:RsiW-degrading membrane proteinase PrsW (M82 family)
VWVVLAGLVVFGALMILVGPRLTPYFTGGGLIAAGLVLAAFPALVWLFIFRRLDRLAPEPHAHLFGAMVLGALLAAAIVEPVRRGVFGLDVWQEDRWFWAIPVYALTQGMLVALAIYTAVRFSVFLLNEFDERTDGIIYGAAAGLGVAVTYNLYYLLDNEGVALDVGTARIIVASLVLASIGGLIGYALGQVRFERHSVLYLPVFVVGAALLIGIYEWVSGQAISRTLGYSPWVSVLIGAVCAAILFAVLNFLVRSTVRETQASRAAAEASAARASGLPATPYGGYDGPTVTDLIVLIGGVALIIAGWALQRTHDSRLETVSAAGLELAYPEGWLPLPALPPALAQWTANDGSGATLTLYSRPVPADENQVQLGSANPAASQAAYTPLGSEPVTINDVAAIQSDYAYAQQQVASSTPPEIVRGREVVWTAGDTQYALALEAPADDWDRVESHFAELARVAVTNGGAS